VNFIGSGIRIPQIAGDEAGALVGIDIDNASTKVQLRELILSRLPSDVHTVAA
jgi:hypothetical protein